MRIKNDEDGEDMKNEKTVQPVNDFIFFTRFIIVSIMTHKRIQSYTSAKGSLQRNTLHIPRPQDPAEVPNDFFIIKKLF